MVLHAMVWYGSDTSWSRGEELLSLERLAAGPLHPGVWALQVQGRTAILQVQGRTAVLQVQGVLQCCSTAGTG